MAKEVQIYVKAVRRKEPDLRKLAKALIRLTLSEQGDSSNKLVSSEQPPQREAAS